jgi:hypothetical protein
MAKTSASTLAPSGPDLRAMIAERAYYKAERRGFAPGFELADWLEAEREFAEPATVSAKPAAKRKTAGTRKSATKKARVSTKG